MIRAATPHDIPAILRLIRELATYEREPDAVEATPERLVEALFPAAGSPAAYALVSETGDGDGDELRVMGMALWFPTFSTWTGRQGMWLEDLYVEPAHRGAGHGKALLAELAMECVRRGWPRLEWTVLDWNAPALAFYQSLGATGMTEWTTHRVTGADLEALSAKSMPARLP